MTGWSIRKRYWSAMLVFVVLIVGMFQLVMVPRITNVLMEVERREVDRQLTVLIDGISPFILSNQNAAIHETLNSVGEGFPDWHNIILTRKDGLQVYPLFRVNRDTGENYIHMSQAIRVHGEPWGTMDVSVDLGEPIAALQRELRRLGLGAILFFLALATGIGVLIDRLVTRRLSQLATAADELGSGDYQVKLPNPSSDEVGRLTESFSVMRSQVLENVSSLEQARAEAERALAAKSRFLATMSHELRTPLNGIIPVAEMLADSKLDPVQHRKVETIHRSSKALLSIVDDILDLARLEEGHLEVRATPFSPAALIEEVGDLLTAAAAQKGLSLSVRVEPGAEGEFLGDKDRIRQVLVNLAGNAVKFTNAGHVTIRCRPDRPGEGATGLTLEVEDTGIGINEADAARIFERFEQAESGPTRRFGGSGLGLPISKALVTALGGRIGLESGRLRGSTFWFTLPLPRAEAQAAQSDPIAAPAPPASAEADTAVPSGRALQVLIADDNAINRDVAIAMVEKLGHQVRAVTNGKEAVEAAARAHFDLVFMDVHMPVMDGLEATRGIRALSPEKAGMFIVALTASVMEEDVARCRAAGMDDVLSKPLTFASIQGAIAASGLPAAHPEWAD